MHQDEADLSVKEKVEKQESIIPRSAKAEEMPEAVNKILNPATRVGCLLMGNTCLVAQRNLLQSIFQVLKQEHKGCFMAPSRWTPEPCTAY